jgi:murein DD-endopeptidase MepM/ murein hydrolase activator NlpD
MNTELLKTLIRLKDKWLRLILIDESVPDGSREYQILPRQFFLGIVALLAFVLMVFMLTLMFTPLGEWVYRSKESKISKQIEQVVGRLDALQDSLDIRDEQLGQMRSIIRLNTDTTLNLDERLQSLLVVQNQGVLGGAPRNSPQELLNLSTQGLISSSLLKNEPIFPTAYPIEGTISRLFNPDEEHFGLDIAATDGALVQALAEGTIVNINWTIANGYVISIQHTNGLLSVYKHCRTSYKREGDVVVKGDVIASVGNAGVQSTASHLHLEIWKDGLPQDPEIYLLK